MPTDPTMPLTVNPATVADSSDDTSITDTPVRDVTAVLGAYSTTDPGTGATDFDSFSDGTGH